MNLAKEYEVLGRSASYKTNYEILLPDGQRGVYLFLYSLLTFALCCSAYFFVNYLSTGSVNVINKAKMIGSKKGSSKKSNLTDDIGAVVKIDGLYKSYGKHSVIRDLDLLIPDSTVTILLGNNGCGKSTLM